MITENTVTLTEQLLIDAQNDRKSLKDYTDFFLRIINDYEIQQQTSGVKLVPVCYYDDESKDIAAMIIIEDNYKHQIEEDDTIVPLFDLLKYVSH